MFMQPSEMIPANLRSPKGYLLNRTWFQIRLLEPFLVLYFILGPKGTFFGSLGTFEGSPERTILEPFFLRVYSQYLYTIYFSVSLSPQNTYQDGKPLPAPPPYFWIHPPPPPTVILFLDIGKPGYKVASGRFFSPLPPSLINGAVETNGVVRCTSAFHMSFSNICLQTLIIIIYLRLFKIGWSYMSFLYFSLFPVTQYQVRIMHVVY